MNTEFELWQNDNGTCYVLDFIKEQGKKRAIEIEQRLEGLQQYPFAELLRSQKVKRLTTEIYEIRMKIKNTSYRFLFLRKEERGILVEAFIKKSQKLPTKHLETAKSRIREIQ